MRVNIYKDRGRGNFKAMIVYLETRGKIYVFDYS